MCSLLSSRRSRISSSILLCLLASSSVATPAETVTEYYLDTVDCGDGQWPCLFYELNYNADISEAEGAGWYLPQEDESYWREGVGPFSIDENKFLVTQWQSTVHPILIRRHFTLDADDLLKISIGAVTLTYSYDEDPTFWLNGTRIVAATGWNDNNYATYRFPAARKRLFVEGDNVLCVSLRQGAGGGHIDYGLSVTYNPNHTDVGEIDGNPLPDDDGQCWYDLHGRHAVGGQAERGVIVTRGRKIIR